MLYRICTVQIQRRKDALDDAGYSGAIRQNQLDHTARKYLANMSALKDLDVEVGTDHADHLSEVCKQYIVAILAILAILGSSVRGVE